MILNTQELKKLRAELESAAETVSALFNQPISPELLEELTALWDACEEYKVAFENFSHE